MTSLAFSRDDRIDRRRCRPRWMFNRRAILTDSARGEVGSVVVDALRRGGGDICLAGQIPELEPFPLRKKSITEPVLSNRSGCVSCSPGLLNAGAAHHWVGRAQNLKMSVKKSRGPRHSRSETCTMISKFVIHSDAPLLMILGDRLDSKI